MFIPQSLSKATKFYLEILDEYNIFIYLLRRLCSNTHLQISFKAIFIKLIGADTKTPLEAVQLSILQPLLAERFFFPFQTELDKNVYQYYL